MSSTQQEKGPLESYARLMEAVKSAERQFVPGPLTPRTVLRGTDIPSTPPRTRDRQRRHVIQDEFRAHKVQLQASGLNTETTSASEKYIAQLLEESMMDEDGTGEFLGVPAPLAAAQTPSSAMFGMSSLSSVAPMRTPLPPGPTDYSQFLKASEKLLASAALEEEEEEQRQAAAAPEKLQECLAQQREANKRAYSSSAPKPSAKNKTKAVQPKQKSKKQLVAEQRKREREVALQIEKSKELAAAKKLVSPAQTTSCSELTSNGRSTAEAEQLAQTTVTASDDLPKGASEQKTNDAAAVPQSSLSSNVNNSTSASPTADTNTSTRVCGDGASTRHEPCLSPSTSISNQELEDYRGQSSIDSLDAASQPADHNTLATSAVKAAGGSVRTEALPETQKTKAKHKGDGTSASPQPLSRKAKRQLKKEQRRDQNVELQQRKRQPQPKDLPSVCDGADDGERSVEHGDVSIVNAVHEQPSPCDAALSDCLSSSTCVEEAGYELQETSDTVHSSREPSASLTAVSYDRCGSPLDNADAVALHARSTVENTAGSVNGGTVVFAASGTPQSCLVGNNDSSSYGNNARDGLVQLAVQFALPEAPLHRGGNAINTQCGSTDDVDAGAIEEDGEDEGDDDCDDEVLSSDTGCQASGAGALSYDRASRKCRVDGVAKPFLTDESSSSDSCHSSFADTHHHVKYQPQDPLFRQPRSSHPPSAVGTGIPVSASTARQNGSSAVVRSAPDYQFSRGTSSTKAHTVLSNQEQFRSDLPPRFQQLAHPQQQSLPSRLPASLHDADQLDRSSSPSVASILLLSSSCRAQSPYNSSEESLSRNELASDGTCSSAASASTSATTRAGTLSAACSAALPLGSGRVSKPSDPIDINMHSSNSSGKPSRVQRKRKKSRKTKSVSAPGAIAGCGVGMPEKNDNVDGDDTDASSSACSSQPSCTPSSQLLALHSGDSGFQSEGWRGLPASSVTASGTTSTAASHSSTPYSAVRPYADTLIPWDQPVLATASCQQSTVKSIGMPTAAVFVANSSCSAVGVDAAVLQPCSLLQRPLSGQFVQASVDCGSAAAPISSSSSSTDITPTLDRMPDAIPNAPAASTSQAPLRCPSPLLQPGVFYCERLARSFERRDLVRVLHFDYVVRELRSRHEALMCQAQRLSDETSRAEAVAETLTCRDGLDATSSIAGLATDGFASNNTSVTSHDLPSKADTLQKMLRSAVTAQLQVDNVQAELVTTARLLGLSPDGAVCVAREFEHSASGDARSQQQLHSIVDGVYEERPAPSNSQCPVHAQPGVNVAAQPSVVLPAPGANPVMTFGSTWTELNKPVAATRESSSSSTTSAFDSARDYTVHDLHLVESLVSSPPQQPPPSAASTTAAAAGTMPLASDNAGLGASPSHQYSTVGERDGVRASSRPPPGFPPRCPSADSALPPPLVKGNTQVQAASTKERGAMLREANDYTFSAFPSLWDLSGQSIWKVDTVEQSAIARSTSPGLLHAPAPVDATPPAAATASDNVNTTRSMKQIWSTTGGEAMAVSSSPSLGLSRLSASAKTFVSSRSPSHTMASAGTGDVVADDLMAAQSADASPQWLLIRNVPSDMDEGSVRLLCQRHGHIHKYVTDKRQRTICIQFESARNARMACASIHHEIVRDEEGRETPLEAFLLHQPPLQQQAAQTGHPAHAGHYYSQLQQQQQTRFPVSHAPQWLLPAPYDHSVRSQHLHYDQRRAADESVPTASSLRQAEHAPAGPLHPQQAIAAAVGAQELGPFSNMPNPVWAPGVEDNGGESQQRLQYVSSNQSYGDSDDIAQRLLPAGVHVNQHGNVPLLPQPAVAGNVHVPGSYSNTPVQCRHDQLVDTTFAGDGTAANGHLGQFHPAGSAVSAQPRRYHPYQEAATARDGVMAAMQQQQQDSYDSLFPSLADAHELQAGGKRHQQQQQPTLGLHHADSAPVGDFPLQHAPHQQQQYAVSGYGGYQRQQQQQQLHHARAHGKKQQLGHAEQHPQQQQQQTGRRSAKNKQDVGAHAAASVDTCDGNDGAAATTRSRSNKQAAVKRRHHRNESPMATSSESNSSGAAAAAANPRGRVVQVLTKPSSRPQGTAAAAASGVAGDQFDVPPACSPAGSALGGCGSTGSSGPSSRPSSSSSKAPAAATTAHSNAATGKARSKKSRRKGKNETRDA
ncbi:mucin-12-like isoform X1 [Sycon ciliatum]|uniref:mucin-12-like isoform X1 n=2 Tax=Sycon ciliatum TaxID=27933 RepID=UPI0031F61A57